MFSSMPRYPVSINWTTGPLVSLIAAIGTLIPFIPIYMKELGLSSTETGIIYGVVPFLSFFTRPLIGAFADKIRHHKAVLIACFLAMGLFYGLLLVTPRQTTDCAIQINSISEHITNRSTPIRCRLFTNDSFNSSNGSSCTITLQCKEFSSILKNRTHAATQTLDINSKDGLKLHCLQMNGKNEMYECILVNEKFGKTFMIFVIIYMFACIPFSSIYSLMDAIAYDILGTKRDLWGRQRLWGTVGFAIFALISSFVMGLRSGDSSNSRVDYSGSFFIFIGLCVISAVVTSRLNVSESLHCKHLIQNVTSLLRYPEIVAFMMVITFIGIFFAVVQGFVFWYLQDLGSTQLTLGLCLVTNCIAEVIMFAIGGKIIKIIGHAACLYISLFAFALRLLCFSILSNVWQAPIIELTHGLCFGLMYDAATEYASIISPKGMSATVQGVIGGLYFGFGKDARLSVDCF